MLFGLFSRGDIVITPEQYNYRPGETIRGTVSLKLKKTTQANKFSILLKGESISERWRNDSKGDRVRDQEKIVIYQFELPLDGQKEYSEAQYPFEILIPLDILPKQATGESILTKMNIGGVNIGGVLDHLASSGVGSVAQSRIVWTLNVALDISGTLDMREKVQINIG